MNPIHDTERLPLRLDASLTLRLGMTSGEVEICAGDPEEMPTLRCVLPRPVSSKVSLLLRVHSKAGIPLASVAAAIEPGDRAFDTAALGLLAMEGYAHLKKADRRAVERRVWSRRAYVTGTAIVAPGL